MMKPAGQTGPVPSAHPSCLLVPLGILALTLGGCGEQTAGASQTNSGAVPAASVESKGSDPFRIDEAKWNREESRLRVKGKGKDGKTVSIANAGTLAAIGQTTVDGDEWLFRRKNPETVPCRVRAEQSDGQFAEKAVTDAPSDCDDGSIGGQPPGPGNGANALTLLGANDLGMHCADLDYQIFSILPPFNVVHSQAIRKGGPNSLPRILDDSEVKVTYHATSSPNDPAGANSINTTSRNNPPTVFKSNFWDDSGHPVPLSTSTDNNTWGGLSYGPLYPGVLAGALVPPPAGPLNLSGECADPATPSGCPSILNVFEPLAMDVGIPVPDPNALFPAAGAPKLVTEQQQMPGPANTPREFGRFDKDLAFFVDFPFGSRIKDVHWFAADGIPALPVDDDGRSNAYPLMQLTALDRNTNDELASLDVVLPVASEADCQNCHADPVDCADPGLPGDVLAGAGACTGAAVSQTAFDVTTLDDNPPGNTRLEQLLNTAKINVLRLHDIKHGDQYRNWDGTGSLAQMTCDPAADPGDPDCLANQTPIQCSRCHYSPALDLAQAGPVDEPEQGLNGRQQTVHISMSRAMHHHHGSLPAFQGKPLFAEMPAPDSPQRTSGALAVNDFEQGVLEESCYQCHPGKRTQCLRGAMFAGGVVCQDCHGNMAQVGDDFTEDFPSTPFPAGANLSKRVSWAIEPKCQSCHTGDAGNPNHPNGAIQADDGIRLLQAYVKGDASATPIHRPASRFAENTNTNGNGDTVDVLYRLSKGHGGVMCEGCHNSTHSIWPVQNPFANDNIASTQLQGHSGTVAECNTCHDPGNFTKGGNLDPASSNAQLKGPHGMHPVPMDTGGATMVTTHFVDGGHEEIAEGNKNTCRACHGNNGQGTVLSRAATDRTFVIKECKKGDLCPGREVENFTVHLDKGTQVSCTLCHENEL